MRFVHVCLGLTQMRWFLSQYLCPIRVNHRSSVVLRAAPSHEFNQFPLLLKSQQIALIHEAGFLGAVAPTPCREEVRS